MASPRPKTKAPALVKNSSTGVVAVPGGGGPRSGAAQVPRQPTGSEELPSVWQRQPDRSPAATSTDRGHPETERDAAALSKVPALLCPPSGSRRLMTAPGQAAKASHRPSPAASTIRNEGSIKQPGQRGPTDAVMHEAQIDRQLRRQRPGAISRVAPACLRSDSVIQRRSSTRSRAL